MNLRYGLAGVLLFTILTIPTGVIGDNAEKTEVNRAIPGAYLGYMFGFGGRYDNLRMCVASPAGAKGGIIAEFGSALIRLRINSLFSLDVNLPAGRAALFAARFKMLQWTPDLTFNFHIELAQSHEILLGPSIGLTFHYGPDYQTAEDDPDKISFFAMGPKLSILVAYQRVLKEGRMLWTIGIRGFWEIFLIPDQPDVPYETGHSLGGMMENSFSWRLF
jgi:hypothetical protein